MEKALVILSGGQDSITCLYWAVKRFGKENVQAITFFYGQRHSVEIQCATDACRKLLVAHTLVDISFMTKLVDSALLHKGQDVNVIDEKGLPASFVPNRNATFITLAHAYAQKIGSKILVTGVCQTDYSGYPDCRRVFIDAITTALNLGSSSTIYIETPLMHLTKEETFHMAYELDCLKDIIEGSRTCYNGDETVLHKWGYGCGECPACELRKKGFEQFEKSLINATGLQK